MVHRKRHPFGTDGELSVESNKIDLDVRAGGSSRRSKRSRIAPFRVNIIIITIVVVVVVVVLLLVSISLLSL